MVLSDVDIKRYLGLGKIKITPELPPEQFGSCSVDFRLGNEFSIFEHSRHPYIDLRDKKGIEDLMKPVMVPDGEAFILQPREFVLAITEESLDLGDDVLGRLERKGDPGIEQSESHASGVVPRNAHLFVYFRAAFDALLDAVLAEERQQV